MEWIRKRKTKSAIDSALGITQDFMELNDKQRLSTNGVRLLKPTMTIGVDAFEEIIIQVRETSMT